MIFSRSCFAVAYCGTQRDVCLIDEEVNFVHFSTFQSNFFTFLNRLVLSFLLLLRKAGFNFEDNV